MTEQTTATHTWTDEYSRDGQPTGWMIRDDGWRLSRDWFEDEVNSVLYEMGAGREARGEGRGDDEPTDAELATADRQTLIFVDELIDSGDTEGEIRIARQQGMLCDPEEIPNSVVTAGWER